MSDGPDGPTAFQKLNLKCLPLLPCPPRGARQFLGEKPAAIHELLPVGCKDAWVKGYRDFAAPVRDIHL